jgi:Galactose oxidase, central domain/Tyrosine-protein kinase ephrin type A/B receptor-like/Kelch motif
LNSGSISQLPNQGNQTDNSISAQLLYYNDYMYLIYNKIFGDKHLVLYRYSLSNYSWEYVTELGEFNHKLACLIDYYIIFTVDDFDTNESKLYSFDLTNYTIVYMGVFYNQLDYCIACTEDKVFVFGGSYENTNLLVELTLNKDKSNFSSLSYKDFTYPNPRTCHSLTQINNYLYLFGGQNEKNYFNDLWVYNTLAGSWATAVTNGNGPIERSSHAAASYGNVLLIWGGESASGYLSDMYMYSSLTEIWTQITPNSESSPSNRKGACMVFEMPFAYIFGGTTAYGISNELWKYDFSYNKYTLISKYNDSGVSYSNCQFEYNIFYSFCGSGKGGHVFYWYLEFNLTSNTWKSIDSPDCLTQGINIKLGYYFIDFGGRIDNGYALNYLKFQTNYTSQSFEISYAPYNTGFAYLGSILYFLYGGCSGIYDNLDYNRGNAIFGSIDINQISKSISNVTLVCSPGYYFFNSTCLPCETGSYSSDFGSYNCKKCGKGTYNNQIAATSVTQCYPCPYKTFSNQVGATLCLICPSGSVCDIGSQKPKPVTYANSIVSIQPSNYVSSDHSEFYLGFQLFFGLFSVVIIILFIFFARHKLQMFDIFDSSHAYELGETITLKKTKIGGIFTLFFFSLALVISVTILLQYNLNNTQETKVLQPLPVLEMEVSNFKATLQMLISFDGYGDSCVVDSKCSPQISFEFFDFKTLGIFSYSCSLVAGSCIIDFNCFGCEISSQSYAVFFLNEKFSYASSISVNVSSTSSIPNSISGVTSSISTKNHQLFIGTIPTEFYFILIPSLFTSSISSNIIKSTGYHVLVDTLPIPGSQYSIQSIQGISLLNIKIYLTQSSSGLYTTRYLSQSFILILSGLLGSITGIMGGMGFFMRLVEGNLKNYIKNKRRRIGYLEIKNKRLILMDSLVREVPDVAANTFISEKIFANTEIMKLD